MTMHITICVPAYNAQSTLDETLWSIRGQTYEDFEAIVVDDGSSDDTATIATAHARADARIRLASKPNGGVASARNLALAQAKGRYFANLDADDVWHPDMLARQVGCIEQAAAPVVVCYSWFAYIDARSRIVSFAEPSEEGDVVRRMCRGNLVGNGSSALIETAALRAIGGWDAALRGRNDDYNAFFALAERGNYAVVPAHLLGYRQITGANMTGNPALMLASYDEVAARFRPKYPQYRAEFDSGRLDLIEYLFDKAVLNRRWWSAAGLVREAWATDRRCAARMVLGLPGIAARIVVPLSVRSKLAPKSPHMQAKGDAFAEIRVPAPTSPAAPVMA